MPDFTPNEARTVYLIQKVRQRDSTRARRREIRKYKRTIRIYRSKLRAAAAATGWDKHDRKARYLALGDVYNARPIGTSALTIRERAYRIASELVGVMEQGGNNMGPMVDRIIRENGGTGPEPWCGDFVAYCYRHAGSKRPQRRWAAVRLLRGSVGVYVTTRPKQGDLVVFTFDHVGMYGSDAGVFIETIEGNTGASGAVSDSSTGGDGVYRKRRPKQQVSYYLRVRG